MNADVFFRGNATSVSGASRSASASVASVGKAAKTTEVQLAGARREADSFTHSIKGIAALTLGTLGAAELVKGIKESINAAGDLEKQQRKIVRVFGETPKVLEAFEKHSAKAYGVSDLAALKAVSSTGALLTNLGVTQKHAAGLSVGIVKLSSDIASFNGLPTAVVADRVNKALLGQTRGLKSLGIALSQSDVNAKALALGLVRPTKSADGLRAATDRVTVAERKYGEAVRDHGKGSKQALSAEAALIAANKGHAQAVAGVVPKLTAQQQALATLALIYERSKKQQGDFGRNSDTLANQQKTLDAEFSNLSDRLGKDLTPAMKTFVEFMAGPGISAAGHFLTSVETDSRKVYAAVQPLAPAAHAAAEGFAAIAHQDGVIPTILAIGAAYKGTTLALRSGQSAYLSAAGVIGNLANPFRTVSREAQVAGNVLVGAGFTGQIVSAASVAEKEAPAFLGLANPIGAIATVAAVAVGGLVLLATTTETAGEKARKARDDFIGLADAVNKVKSTKLDVQQSTLDVQTARHAISTFSPTLIAARDAARKSFPDTPAGDRASAAAKDALSGALLRNKQLYLDLARSKQRLTEATAAEGKAEGDQRKQVTDTANAFDGLRGKLLEQEELHGALGIRVNHTAGETAAAGRAADQFAKKIGSLAAQTKDLSPAQRTAIGLIRDFISRTKEIPDKKTFKILVEDAARGKIAAVKRDLLGLPASKSITITALVRGTPFEVPPILPAKAKAAGDVITRPQLAIVGEEAPAWPEFIVPTNPARRGRALGLIGQMRSWIPGFADGTGPSGALNAQERRAIANTPAKSAAASKRSGSGSKPKSALQKWLDAGSKLPDDDSYANAIARGEANLADAGRTAAKSDDIRALHALIKIASGRDRVLHGPKLRGAHRDWPPWQLAVNTGISTVSGQLSGYQSSLRDLVKRPSVDEIQINLPGSIRWAIESAGFSADPADDVRAQKRKAAWLQKEIKKAPRGSNRRTALLRELARTQAEISSLGATSDQQRADDLASAQSADEQAHAASLEVPIDIQQALADASLTADSGDDLAALIREREFLQGRIDSINSSPQASRRFAADKVALTQQLASVNDQISGITSSSGGGTTPDQQAVNQQTVDRLALVTRQASLSEAELAALRSSGDIGTGGFANALSAGPGLAALVVLGDGRSAAAVAASAAQGFSAQAAVPSSRLRVGIA